MSRILAYVANIPTDQLELTRLILFLLFIAANVGVTAGVIMEWEENSHSTKRNGWRLLVISLGLEIFLSSATFGIDLEIGRRQKDEIFALQTKLLPRSQLLAGRDAEIEGALRLYPNTKFDCAMGANSSEQLDFWRDLEAILKRATWVHLDWDDGHTQPLGAYNSQTVRDQPLCGPATAKNVEVDVPPEHAKELGPAAEALVSVLNGARISAAKTGLPVISMNKATIHIQIGEKR